MSRTQDDLYISDTKKSEKLFETGSSITNLANATTISSSVFAEISSSFASGEHLIDPSIRDGIGSVMYAIQKLEDDVSGIYNELSASVFKGSFSPVVTTNTAVVSGSILPGDSSGSVGSIDAPFKDLYVQSSSIYLADTTVHNFGAGNKTWAEMSEAERLQRSSIFKKDDLDDILEGKPPRGVAPLSRFSNTISMEARIGAANRWYSRSRTGQNLLSLQIGTSDPDGTNILAVYALKGAVYIAPQDLLINRVSCTMVNDRNNDNIIVTMFKGTVVNDSNAAVQIDQIGSTFAPTMVRNKTYVTVQTLTSGNQL